MNVSAEHFDNKARQWDSNPFAQERAIKIADAIGAAVPLSPPMTALDYGCGTGLLSVPLKDKLGTITLMDSSSGMLAVLREKITAQGIANMVVQPGDLTHTALPDTHFDIIYSSMTLHHIPDTGAILQRFHTLLKPGGVLCIADLDEEDGTFHDSDIGFHVHHGFNRTVLAEMAHKQGFVAVNFSTIFEVTKQRANGEQRYPVFLMVARRD